MAKTVTAEYDAEACVLRLDAPIEGLPDRARVRVTLEADLADHSSHPWLALRNVLSTEAGDSLAEAVETMFGKKNPTLHDLRGALDEKAGAAIARALREGFGREGSDE